MNLLGTIAYNTSDHLFIFYSANNKKLTTKLDIQNRYGTLQEMTSFVKCHKNL